MKLIAMRFWFYLWLFSLVTAFAYANQAGAQVATPLAFQVRSIKGGPISYLFGTFHEGIGLAELPKAFLQLQDRTAVHAYEVDGTKLFLLLARLKSNSDSALAALLRDAGYDPTQSGDFNDAEVKQLVALGIPENVSRKLRDHNLALFMARANLFGPGPPKSLDAELELRTKRTGKILVELESDVVRERARAKATEQGYRHDQSIRAYLQQPTKITALDQELARYMKAYKTLRPQDVLDLPDDDDPAVALRTAEWLKRLAPMMRTKATFVAVGEGHLVGPHGLIQLLQKVGYSVTPMRID